MVHSMMEHGTDSEDEPSEIPPTADPIRPPWRFGIVGLIALGLIVGLTVVLRSGGDAEPIFNTLPTGLETPPRPGGVSGLAPDFEAELLLTEGTFRLSSHLATDGRPVVINLWASWCSPCRREMPALDHAAADHPDVLFIGVAVDDARGAALDFADEILVSYPLAFDHEGRMDEEYVVPGLPSTFLVDENGVLRRSIYGEIGEGELDDIIATTFG